MKYILVVLAFVALLGAGCITDSGSDEDSVSLIGRWEQINGDGHITFRADGSYYSPYYGTGTYTTGGQTLTLHAVRRDEGQVTIKTDVYEYYQDEDFLTIVTTNGTIKTYGDYRRTTR